ncbi:MAG: NAD-dependent epimerase/dehydratase family protein [Dehalococcoidia bacterium]
MILLIGGLGFIGMHTTRQLLDAGESVVATYFSILRLPEFLKDEVGKGLSVARMDVSKPFEVFDIVRQYRVESVIDLMAPPARGTSPHFDYHMYTAGLQNVLESARVFGLKRVSLGSSGSVYAGLPEGPYREDMLLPIESRTQVEAFKKSMEIQAFHYADRADLNVVSLRIGSIYGPLYYSMFNAASRMCHAALKGEEPDFSDRPGGAIFAEDAQDWTYVKDVARGIRMVHTAETLNHRIYNVSAGRATSNQETYAAVRQAIPEAQCSALRPGRAPNAANNPAMDLSRVRADIGYEPEYNIERGIAEYIEWLRGNPL